MKQKKQTLRASWKQLAVQIATLVLIAGATFLAYRWYTESQLRKELLGTTENLDFTGMEPQVVQKIQKLGQQVRNNPKSADAWGKLAMNLDVHDFKEESAPLYKEAARLDRSNFRWPYFAAMVLSQLNSQESLKWFEHAAQMKMDYAPLLIHYASALGRFGRRDEAEQKYQQALHIDPQSSHARLGLAEISFAKGDLNSSRSHLAKAVEANPAHKDVYELLATVCKQQKDTTCAQRAEAFANRMPDKMPLPDSIYAELTLEGESSVWYRFRGSEFLKSGMNDQAIAQFQHALQLRPDVQTREDLAKALSAAGKYSDAIRQYRSVLAQRPTAENYFGVALAQARMGSYAEAETYFRKAIEQKAEFPEAYFNLAVLFAKQGRLKETIESLKQAIRINPAYAEAHYHLGLAYIAAQNPNAAMKEHATLARLDPELAEKLRISIKNQEMLDTEKQSQRD